MVRILVVGSAGQVGEKIAKLALKQGNEVYGTYKTRQAESIHSDFQFQMDKTNALAVDKILSKVKPDFVIDTGALHNVDYCETHPEETYAVNAEGTRTLSLAAKRLGASFMFVSTDYVFDGANGPYSEEDLPNPQSVYAKSKLEGEKGALAANENTCVIRPSVIYSWVPKEKLRTGPSSSGKPLNFAAWTVSQVAQNKNINVVTDQIASPTLADDLAGSILALSNSSKPANGVYHCAGATPLSRFDFSMLIAKKLGLDEGLIHPTDSSKFKQIAKRPLNSSLVSNRIASETGYMMMPIGKALEEFSRQRNEEE